MTVHTVYISANFTEQYINQYKINKKQGTKINTIYCTVPTPYLG